MCNINYIHLLSFYLFIFIVNETPEHIHILPEMYIACWQMVIKFYIIIKPCHTL